MIFQSSAEVTAWPERILLTLAFVGLVSFIYFMMYKNWQKKLDRDQYLEKPLRINGRISSKAYEGKYIATTYADDWLKRIHIRGLTLPSVAELRIFEDGIGLELNSTDFFIPFQDIASINSVNALAGKVFESEGLIAITWKLGAVVVVTGFRAKTANDHIAILQALVTHG